MSGHFLLSKSLVQTKEYSSGMYWIIYIAKLEGIDADFTKNLIFLINNSVIQNLSELAMRNCQHKAFLK